MRSPRKWLPIPHISTHPYARKATCFALAAALVILGPSVGPDYHWLTNTPAHYKEEVLEFVKECGTLCPRLSQINLRIRDDIVTPPPEVPEAIAMCTVYIANLRLVREVTMDIRYKGSPLQQRATLWHELIHCILLEDHVERWDFDLMDTHDRSHEFYEENWDALVHATFCRIAKKRQVKRKGCTP